MYIWICQRSAYFKFIPSAHTPFEEREPMGLKVDIANDSAQTFSASEANCVQRFEDSNIKHKWGKQCT